VSENVEFRGNVSQEHSGYVSCQVAHSIALCKEQGYTNLTYRNMMEKLERHLANLISGNANARAYDVMTMVSYAYVISACQMSLFDAF
jgi:hypothetical protein